jgi:CheY-like chemotaxis protein
MDLHMPQMGGIEATRAIRALDGAVAAIPIVAATAGAMDHEIRACLAAGMNAAVPKPIDPRVLTRTLAEVVGAGATAADADAVDGAADEEEDEEEDASAILERGSAAFEPILIDRLAAQLGADFAEEMAGDFAGTAAQALAEIAAARHAGDPVAWADAAHKLKSGAGTVGLRAVWRLAEGIERDAEAGDTAGAAAASDRLPTAIEDGRALLADHLRRSAAAQAPGSEATGMQSTDGAG